MAERGSDGGGCSDVPLDRLPPGRGDLSLARQCLSALRARRLVGRSGQAAPGGPRIPDPLRGRLRNRVHRRVGRTTSDGGAAEAFRQVRTGDPPGQDATGAVCAAPGAEGTGGAGVGGPTRDVCFLGFTHYWGKSRRDNAVVKKRTAASRIRRFAKAIGAWCRRNRHRPIQEQHATLSQKLRGHDAYYGVTGNCSSLNRMRAIVARIWRKWLSRRSWKGRFGWASLWGLLERMPLPAARVVHSVYRRV